jgi:hypothetical protein
VSSDNWSAKVGSREIRWTADELLTGDIQLVLELQRELIRQQAIKITPTGPSVDADEDNPYAVVALLRQLYPEAIFTDAPDLTELWIDDLPDGPDVIF